MSYYEENYEEWFQQFSIERQEGNLFLIKNHISNNFTIATNFDINTASYYGNKFLTTTKKELAIKAFAEVLALTQSYNKVGVLA